MLLVCTEVCSKCIGALVRASAYCARFWLTTSVFEESVILILLDHYRITRLEAWLRLMDGIVETYTVPPPLVHYTQTCIVLYSKLTLDQEGIFSRIIMTTLYFLGLFEDNIL